ncbi:bifunctional serine/threonine-protein kinase/universal stress protein [Pseudoxanthomonas putridarboris]|uniref:Bifunctional serine/threonine-protein kinase/universal stress protein n=1 Tax=Pseudoxanthomonas putridarboris TaxID=752605 RepID=A0ABU9J464_9GAMM
MPVKLHAGLAIDGFTLEEPLHEGGMATLWRVRHPDHALPMLMKLPRIQYGEAVSQIVGFEVERMLLPVLRGPHVPRYIATGDYEDQPYLVMEHVSGDTLRPLLDRTPLPADRVAHLGALSALALEDLHRQHVVHLDIKPSNLLLHADANGERIVLIDFGLSRHSQLPDLLAEQFHIPMGTAPYIAPEQVLGIRSDPRSDLFALGVTLYHLATGQRPFGFPSSQRGLKRRFYQDPAPPRSLVPDLPRWLQEIILRCLEVDADARHPTAAQLAFDLQHPEQVVLTERGERMQRSGALATTRRWWRFVGHDIAQKTNVADAARAPLIMVAVDLKHHDLGLNDALRDTVQRIVQTSPGARLACITVMRTARIGLDSNLDADGRNRHVKRLVGLRDWARPLELPHHRITFHVLESSDVADALVDYARNNVIDHLIMGARGVTGVRRILGSVSARVVAEANCTTTVVRSRADGAAEATAPP